MSLTQQLARVKTDFGGGAAGRGGASAAAPAFNLDDALASAASIKRQHSFSAGSQNRAKALRFQEQVARKRSARPQDRPSIVFSLSSLSAFGATTEQIAAAGGRPPQLGRLVRPPAGTRAPPAALPPSGARGDAAAASFVSALSASLARPAGRFSMPPPGKAAAPASAPAAPAAPGGAALSRLLKGAGGPPMPAPPGFAAAPGSASAAAATAAAAAAAAASKPAAQPARQAESGALGLDRLMPGGGAAGGLASLVSDRGRIGGFGGGGGWNVQPQPAQTATATTTTTTTTTTTDEYSWLRVPGTAAKRQQAEAASSSPAAAEDDGLDFDGYFEAGNLSAEEERTRRLEAFIPRSILADPKNAEKLRRKLAEDDERRRQKEAAEAERNPDQDGDDAGAMRLTAYQARRAAITMRSGGDTAAIETGSLFETDEADDIDPSLDVYNTVTRAASSMGLRSASAAAFAATEAALREQELAREALHTSLRGEMDDGSASAAEDDLMRLMDTPEDVLQMGMMIKEMAASSPEMAEEMRRSGLSVDDIDDMLEDQDIDVRDLDDEVGEIRDEAQLGREGMTAEEEAALVERMEERERRRAARKPLHEMTPEERRRHNMARRTKQLLKATSIAVADAMTVGDVAEWARCDAGVLCDVLGEAMGLDGGEVTPLTPLSADMCDVLCDEFGADIVRPGDSALDVRPTRPPENADELARLPRRPVVACVMGHVNHGKTSLLDALRKSNRAASEHGSITQGVGAFRVPLSESLSSGGGGAPTDLVTFMDTPGHAAFNAMRRRGVSLTDIVVLVVAADDGVQPQTVESIELARELDSPVVVAMNKMDRPGADPDRVRNELAAHGVVAESMGGDTLVAEVSALTGEGLAEVADSVALAAEMLELRAPADAPAEVVVVDTRKRTPRGPMVSVLVRQGTLRTGDVLVSGFLYGRVRVLLDDWGRQVDEAAPGSPVNIIGLSAVEELGVSDDMLVVPTEARAREVVRFRRLVRDAEARVARRVADEGLERAALELGAEGVDAETAEELLGPDGAVHLDGEGVARGLVKDVSFEESRPTLRLVIKADVRNSLEAIEDYLRKLPRDELDVQVLGAGLGPVTSSDLRLASLSGAPVLCFMTSCPAGMRLAAERGGVRVHEQKIIYRLFDDVRGELSRLLPPASEAEVVGRGKVLKIFPLRGPRGKEGRTAAGVDVREGTISRNNSFRVRRDDEIVFADGTVFSMRHVRDDIEEAAKGMECGMVLDGFDDFREGDFVEAYEMVSRPRHFDDRAARGEGAEAYARPDGGGGADDHAEAEGGDPAGKKKKTKKKRQKKTSKRDGRGRNA